MCFASDQVSTFCKVRSVASIIPPSAKKNKMRIQEGCRKTAPIRIANVQQVHPFSQYQKQHLTSHNQHQRQQLAQYLNNQQAMKIDVDATKPLLLNFKMHPYQD